jgi:hypothetical protein
MPPTRGGCSKETAQRGAIPLWGVSSPALFSDGMKRTSNIRIALTAGALLLLASLGSAQMVGDSACEARIRTGIRYVYNLSFDSASAEFQQVVHSRPDHPAGYFFLAMVDWWRIITDFSNKSYDDRFISRLDNVIEMCDRRLENDGNDLPGLFFKGGALGFQGRLYGNREEWLKAANCGREALPIVQKAYALAPEDNDILLGMGIYNYYAAVVPEQYPFVKPLMIFFPKGDKVKGIRQLTTASEKAIYAKIEATYFLMQVFQNYEKQYREALPLAQHLSSLFPDNALFQKYLGRAYTSVGSWEEMRNTYQEMLRRAKAHRVGYDPSTEREASYYLGLYEMNARHLDEALTYFYRSDEISRALDIGELSGFMVMTNLKIGMIYDLQGKRELAVVQYKKVLDMKNFMDAHKQAEQYIKSPYQKS